MNWRRLGAGLYWAPDWGSAYRIDGEWWAMNSSDKTMPIEPVVGPFRTSREARDAYDRAMKTRA